MNVFLLALQLVAVLCIVFLAVWGGGILVRSVKRSGVRGLITPLLVAIAIVGPQAVFFVALGVANDGQTDWRPRVAAYPSRSCTWTKGVGGLPIPDTDIANESFVGLELYEGALPVGTLPSVDALASLNDLSASLDTEAAAKVIAVVRHAVGADGGVAEGWTPFSNGRPVPVSRDGGPEGCLPRAVAREAMTVGFAVGHRHWPDLGEAEYAAWRASPALVRFVAVATGPDEDRGASSASGYGMVYGGGLETPDIAHANGMSIGRGMGAEMAVPSAAALASLRGLKTSVPTKRFESVKEIVGFATPPWETYGIGEGWVPFSDGRPVMTSGQGVTVSRLPESAAKAAMREGAWTGRVDVPDIGLTSFAVWRASPALVRYVYLPEKAPRNAAAMSDAPTLSVVLLWCATVIVSVLLVVAILRARRHRESGVLPASTSRSRRGRSIGTRLFGTILFSMLAPPVLLVGLPLLVFWPGVMSSAGEPQRPGDRFFEDGALDRRLPASADLSPASDWSRTSTVTSENEDRLPSDLIVASLAGQKDRLPEHVYRRMLEVLRGRAGQDWIGQGGFVESWPGELPWTAIRDLKDRGWSVGPGWFEGAEGQYAAWTTDAREGYYFWRSGDQGAGGLAGWWSKHYDTCFQVALWLGVCVVSASVAAFALSRRITGPITDVAAASRRLAAGELPGRIEVDGPPEVVDLAESFNHMADRLAEVEANERQFLMSVSHELKTPLTAIEGFAELLADGAVPAKDASAVLSSESRRLQRLVADLLDLGKLRQSAFSVRREAVSLERVIGEVRRRYEAQAREFGVALEGGAEVGKAAKEQEGTVALADEDRLVQVVSNLVENALRCTPAGGAVTIAVSGDELRVSDTGPGLSDEEQEHAFERFYLYERCGKDRPVGTGLGLAIVKELMDAMGGTVTVTSMPGAGTTFTLRLPAPPG